MVYEYCVNLSIDLAMKSINISPPTPHPYFQVTLGVQNNIYNTLHVIWGMFYKIRYISIFILNFEKWDFNLVLKCSVDI